MPELPDVEGFKTYFDSNALRKKIVGVSAPDSRVVKDTSIQAIGRKLKGKVFTGTRRWGKYLFAEPEGGGSLVLHFGMTGDLAFYKKSDESPKFESVIFDFANGQRLAYLSQRKLGRVSWVEDVDAFADAEQLGLDAMSEELTLEKFSEVLMEHRTFLKSGLMNQSGIAGIGNIWADEILYQAELRPKARTGDLDAPALKKLYQAMRRVLKTGSRAMREEKPVPHTYIVPHRDTDQLCPKCNSRLKSTKVSGRTSYYCSECQG